VTDHSDAEGFYLPIDFADVIVPPEDAGVAGGYIGSSFALLRECEELARSIGVPLDLDTETDELFKGGDGSQRWHAYHVEARVCLVLHRAAVVTADDERPPNDRASSAANALTLWRRSMFRAVPRVAGR
jgi:hypothetical protein